MRPAPFDQVTPEPSGQLRRLAGSRAEQVIAALIERQQSVAVAESLTGGLVSATLVGVPGASAVVRGAIVAYASDLKVSLLGVPADLVAQWGVVTAEVAAAMAVGVAGRLGATHAIATTGLAGPASPGGAVVGTVFVAHSGPGGDRVRRLQLPGDRDAVRWAAVIAALELLLEGLDHGDAVIPTPG